MLGSLFLFFDFFSLSFMLTLRLKRREDRQWRLAVRVQGSTYEQSFDEEDKGSFGMYLWPSATLLTRFLLEAPPCLISGKRVIELGAGTGLCGIAAAGMCAPASVVLTDVPGPVLANLRENVSANAASAAVAPAPMAVAALPWGNVPKEVLASPELWVFDVVLAADCLYAESRIGDFFAAVAALASLNPGLVCYLTYQERCTDTCVKPYLDFWDLRARELPVEDLIALPAGVLDEQEINPTTTLRLIEITTTKKQQWHQPLQYLMSNKEEEGQT